MSSKTISAIAAVLAVTALAWSPYSQASSHDKAAPETAAASQSPIAINGISATRMIGASVQNAQGETLGEVHDLIVTSDKGITYAIIDVGGYLGVGETRVVIPYAELQLSGGNRIVLDATEESLKGRLKLTYPDHDRFVLTGVEARPSEDDTNAEYERAMKERISEWSQKMDEYTAKAKKEAKQAATAADKSLDRAWSNVETQWNELKRGSDETWNDTQQSLDKAWENFERAWGEATRDQG